MLRVDSDEECVEYAPRGRWRSPSPIGSPRNRGRQTEVRFNVPDESVEEESSRPRILSEKISPLEKSLFWDRVYHHEVKTWPKEFSPGPEWIRQSIVMNIKARDNARMLEGVVSHLMDESMYKITFQKRDRPKKGALKGTKEYLENKRRQFSPPYLTKYVSHACPYLPRP